MNKKAFTLIELLVVVLIIGILAAIALPKYELAVEKSRLAEALTMASSLQKAIDVYVLENGYPASGTIYFLGDNVNGSLAIDLSNLDCSEVSCKSKNFSYSAACFSSGYCFISMNRLGGNIDYTFGYENTGSGWHGDECDYFSDPIGEKICKQLEAQGNGFYACENGDC